ncbi:hypothetical protein LCGC14_2993730, partial [marine sediment metagenome]
GNQPKLEPESDVIIIVKTVATTPARMMKGPYKGYVTSLRADPANTGNIYIGKGAEICTYPLKKDDAQITRADLDKLFYYSDNGTEKLHIWAERVKA